MYDCRIINGRVYMDGRFRRENVYFKDGLIASVCRELLDAAKSYDAQGNYVLPGLIDPHVHFDLKVGESLTRDNFYHGSVRAAFGGVTTFIDFLKPVSSKDELDAALLERKKEADNAIIDYSFHTTIAGYRDSLLQLGKWTVDQGLPSIKIFTTYSSTNRQTKDPDIAELLLCSKESGYRLLVHAENDAMIDESPGAHFSQHAKRRPPLSEISEVAKLAAMCEYTGGYLYIVHTNCGTTVKMLCEKYDELLYEKRLVLESAPHYLCMDSSIYFDPAGYRYVMTPPLRPKKEQEILNDYFDSISLFGTDHCPYKLAEKNHDELDLIPNGIEGEPYMFPLLYKRFGDKVIPKLTSESAKIHGLYPRKGVIREGSDADCIIFDPDVSWKGEDLVPWLDPLNETKEPSPYDDIELQGKVVTTFSRGVAVVDDGRLFEHTGEFLKRDKVS